MPGPVVDPVLLRHPPPAALHWVGDVLGARVTAVRVLTGGTSHANHAVTLKSAAKGRTTVVLRRWARPPAPGDAEYGVEREVAVLSLLERTAVPAPHVLAADPDGRSCDVPALVLTLLEGRAPGPDVRPGFVQGLADAALAIHGVVPVGVPGYRPYNDAASAQPPVGSRHPLLWEQAIERALQTPPADPGCFVHRDFHHGNTLWARGRLTGIVDWTAASVGPAAIDVAHMRWNLVVAYGADVADAFTRSYLQRRPEAEAHLRWWDARTVVDLLEHDPRWPFTPPVLARLEAHLQRAMR